MRNEVFIDMSGFYALLAGDDDRHAQAAAYLHMELFELIS
jgi:hypothetical protein